MENEITGPVDLCLPDGRVNPDAIGWGRRPHWRCNLHGRRLRRKQWDYWCVLGPEQLLSVTLANVGYAGLGGAYVFDYASRRMADCGVALPFWGQPAMPETTMGTAQARLGQTEVLQEVSATRAVLRVRAARCSGKPLVAEVVVYFADDLESLNVVVPWTARDYQFTSKQLGMPAEGEVRWGDEKWQFSRETAVAVRDFGRGYWPFRTRWNWGALCGKTSTGRVAVNLGGQWTDGTGATENGLILNGVLHPIADRVVFDSNHQDYLQPWHIHTPESSSVDLTLEPIYDRITNIKLGPLRMNVHQCFGRFHGQVRTGGEEVTLENCFGWAEEQYARW